MNGIFPALQRCRTPRPTLGEFEAVNPAFARKGRSNEVLKGRIEGLH